MPHLADPCTLGDRRPTVPSLLVSKHKSIHAEIIHLRYVPGPSSVLQSPNRQAGRHLNLPPPRIGGPAFLLAGPRSRHPPRSRLTWPGCSLRCQYDEPDLRSVSAVICVVHPGFSGAPRSAQTSRLACASSRPGSEVLRKPHLLSRCRGNAGPKRRSATRQIRYRSSLRR